MAVFLPNCSLLLQVVEVCGKLPSELKVMIGGKVIINSHEYFVRWELIHREARVRSGSWMNDAKLETEYFKMDLMIQFLETSMTYPH